MPRNYYTSNYGKITLGLITGIIAGTAALLIWASMGTNASGVSDTLFQSILSPTGPQCCNLSLIGLGFVRIKHYVLGLVLMGIGAIVLALKIEPFIGAFLLGFGGLLFIDEIALSLTGAVPLIIGGIL